MNCQRCSGLTVSEYAYEYETGKWIELERCIQCGGRFDSTIALHATIPPMPSRGHGEKLATGMGFEKRLAQHIRDCLGGAV